MQFTAEVKDSVDIAKIQALETFDEIMVGWPSGMPHANSNETLDEIAKKLHFGFVAEDGAQVPSRPLLTDAINYNASDLKEEIGRYYKGKVEGGDLTTKPLFRIGAMLVGAVKRFAFGGYYQSTIPNALSTIVRKSKPAKGKALAQISDKPWIDTAQTVNAITYLVNQKSPPAKIKKGEKQPEYAQSNAATEFKEGL